jgi:NDMA-dependent alcohol dehydrogenase
MKTRGAVIRGMGEAWSIEEIDIEGPTAGEVLVEWKAAGLCHSDDHFRTGDRVHPSMADDFYPLLGGHEGAGVVAEVGSGVTTVEVGDHVCASFTPACGRCKYCATGRGYLCNALANFFGKGQLTDGVSRHSLNGEPLQVTGKIGTFCEKTVVAERSVIKIDTDIPLPVAAIVSCGVTTGWGSAANRAGTQPGDVVVVIGTGGLGISAVQGARICGAREIVAVDPIAHRRDSALKFGATRAAASAAEAMAIVRDLTWGQGADRVIMTPSLSTGEVFREAMELTGKGGVCVVTGMAPISQTEVPLDLGILTLYNKDIRGCTFGSLDPREAFPRLFDLYRSGLLNLDDMITTYPLDEINEGYRETLEGINIRGVLLS